MKRTFVGTLLPFCISGAPLAAGGASAEALIRGRRSERQPQFGAFASASAARPHAKDSRGKNKRLRQHKKTSHAAADKTKHDAKGEEEGGAKNGPLDSLEYPPPPPATPRTSKAFKPPGEEPGAMPATDGAGGKAGKHGKGAKASKSAKESSSSSSSAMMAPSGSPTMEPSPSPTDHPTDTPTYIPDNAEWYDSFESGEFPSGGWSVDTQFFAAKSMTTAAGPDRGDTFRAEVLEDLSTTFRDEFKDDVAVVGARHEGGDSRQHGGEGTTTEAREEERYWALTTKKSKTGLRSIAAPRLDNRDGTPRGAYVTLRTDRHWGEGHLTFSLAWELNYPGSDVAWYVDGEFYDWVPVESSERWREFRIYLDGGRHEVTWEYAYNPEDVVDPPGGGYAYMDDVYFAAKTDIPTYAPTLTPTFFPTAEPTTNPTESAEPTMDLTMKPTTSPTLSPTLSPSQYPTYFPTLSNTTSNATSIPTYFPSISNTTSIATSAESQP